MKAAARGTVLAVMLAAASCAWSQASALPSAQSGGGPLGANLERGRNLMDQMVAALGGEKWLNRRTWVIEGKFGTFYKGSANPYVDGFEEYDRAAPFGRRVIIVSRSGIFIPTYQRDLAEVFTEDGAYEVSFKGKKSLPKADVEEFLRRQKYTLDVIVKQWLKQPGTLVTFEGTDMVDRRLADKVSILTEDNRAVVLELDEETHLPLSRTYEYRNPVYKDLDTEVEQYDGYHAVDGIQTPYTVTRLHNGDMVSQRFYTKVTFNVDLPSDLFDPDKRMERPKKK